MQYLRHSYMIKALTLALGCISIAAHAADNSLSPQDNSIDDINKRINESSRLTDFNILSTELPSESTGPQMSKEDSKVYLKEHPEEFEALLSKLLTQANAEALEELLPVYQQVPNYDPSVVDWGNAIIAAKKGDLDKAVRMYRKINAQLPEVKILRFQMAMALFYNRQFDAAQSEFEKLRSDVTSEADIQVVNKYLDAISSQNRWSFGGSVSYMDDKNITNAPEQGTSIVRPDGSAITYTSPREEGHGLNYSVYGDRKWLYDNKMFTAVHLNSYGKYYWDNKGYNDVTAGIGAGIGYQNAMTEVEIGPFYNKRWYAQGKGGDEKLKSYTDSTGVKLNVNQWISPKLRYQGLVRYADTNYIDRYSFNDGSDWLLANTAVYLPNGQQFWTFGVDYSTRSSDDDSLAYDRPGMRVGWGQTWPKGYTTRLDLGYAQRNYDGEDFFGIKRKNDEYNAGITAWNRGWSILGLTPRLSWNYNKVSSNSPFEEYDKHDVSLELTKAF